MNAAITSSGVPDGGRKPPGTFLAAATTPVQDPRRLRQLNTIAAITLTVAALLALGRIHLFMLREPAPLSMDEGYMGGLAARLLTSGLRPGVDGISQRGPALYWLVALFQAAFGTYSWVGIRVLAWVVPSVTVLACLGIGAAVGLPLAGAVAGALYTVAMLGGLLPGDGVGLNGEHVSGMLAVVATLLVALALRRRSRATLGLAAAGGAFAALAGLAKQISLPCVVPLLLWTLLHERGAARRRLATLALGGGWLLAVVAVLGVYVAAGALGSFWYWFYTYNAGIFMAPFRDVSWTVPVARWFLDHAVAVSVLGYVAVASLARLVARTHALRPTAAAEMLQARPLEWVALVQLACALAGVIVQKRFFNHQGVTMLPWIGLLVGLGTERALDGAAAGPEARQRAAAVTALGLAALVIVGGETLLSHLKDERERGAWTSPYDGICQALDRHTRPGDPLYVWGFDADIYVTCHRRPASRFVYTTMVAGVVPPFWDQARPERVARGARAMTRVDLERMPPAAMLDMPARLGGLSMRAVPEIAQFMDAVGYCDRGEVEGKLGRRARLWTRGDCPDP
jgi:hypothetical protein